MTVQPIDPLYQFGFAMAAGILLDTFLIRGLLVPAIVAALGDRARWRRPDDYRHRRRLEYSTAE